MTFVIRSPAVCARPAFPQKIVKLCLVTPIIRWPVITRALTSDASSNRRIFFSAAAVRRPCYAWATVAGNSVTRSHALHSRKQEDLVLRAKCMNLDAVRGTGGQLVPQWSHRSEEDLV